MFLNSPFSYTTVGGLGSKQGQTRSFFRKTSRLFHRIFPNRRKPSCHQTTINFCSTEPYCVHRLTSPWSYSKCTYKRKHLDPKSGMSSHAPRCLLTWRHTLSLWELGPAALIKTWKENIKLQSTDLGVCPTQSSIRLPIKPAPERTLPTQGKELSFFTLKSLLVLS